MGALDKCVYRQNPKNLDLDKKNFETPPARSFVEEATPLELKAIPPHLRYSLLGMDETLQPLLWHILMVHKSSVW